METSGALKRLVHLSDRVGAGDGLRAVHRRISPLARRNHADNLHLRLLLAHGLAHDANCVDVGAHGGAVLADMVRYAPDGQHVAFEPLPAQAAALRTRFPGVEVHEAAVSDTPGTASFTHVRSVPELSGLRDRGLGGPDDETLEVQVVRLDDVLDPSRPVALIKVDVEGAELGVFRGARETLARDRPTIAFEHGVGGSDHFGTSSADVHDLLVGELGYRLFDIDGGGPLDRRAFEALFTKPIWFFVAHR